MNELPKNYIGITGCTNVDQVQGTIGLFDKYGITISNSHVPMIGLLISPRNLDPSWCSARYPSLSTFQRLVDAAAGRCFLTFHIDEKASSRWIDDLFSLLDRIPNSRLVNGIQINVKHPNLDDISRLREKTRFRIILQYSNDFLGLGAWKALDEITPYVRHVHYLLIDPSRGRKIGIDVDSASEHYNVIKKKHGTRINIGFAGGFTPENIGNNIERFHDNIGRFDFSIDVESGVRTNDVLDLLKVEKFIESVSSKIRYYRT